MSQKSAQIGHSEHIIVPGQLIPGAQGLLRGHGTYTLDESSPQPQLAASVAGPIARINKFISVRSVKSRYASVLAFCVHVCVCTRVRR
jgi:exosome complex RNA-binding protein Rrp4